MKPTRISNRPFIQIHALHGKRKGEKVNCEAIKQKPIRTKIELDFKFDCIIPVPSSCTMAKRLAKAIGKPSYCIRKTRKTKVRSLPISKRKAITENLFKIIGEPSIEGKTILLVDDITTTGMTLNSIARLLIQSGASKVYGLVYLLNK